MMHKNDIAKVVVDTACKLHNQYRFRNFSEAIEGISRSECNDQTPPRMKKNELAALALLCARSGK